MEIVSGKCYQSWSPAAPARRSSAAGKLWGLSDPEKRRRKRVAKYKVYSIEGRVKCSFRNGLRWFKNKCSHIVHGF